MTDWFARPILHVKDVGPRFYVDRLGLTNPWRHNEDGKADVAQVDRGGDSTGIRMNHQRNGRAARYVSRSLAGLSRIVARAGSTVSNSPAAIAS
jgi:hypothetical protein